MHTDPPATGMHAVPPLQSSALAQMSWHAEVKQICELGQSLVDSHGLVDDGDGASSSKLHPEERASPATIAAPTDTPSRCDFMAIPLRQPATMHPARPRVSG
jgi:hypothetical protein